MRIYCGTSENKYDFWGNKTQLFMYHWSYINLWIVKINLGYEYYNFVNTKDKTLVKNNDGSTYVGKNLETIEIKWGWK